MVFGFRIIMKLRRVVFRENMKKYIYTIIVFLVIFLMFYLSKIESERFPYLSDYNEKFSGIVEKNVWGQAGVKRIAFKDKTIFYVESSFISDTVKGDQLILKRWDQKILNRFLLYGDSVAKPQNSDTVFVYRNQIEYVFVNRLQ